MFHVVKNGLADGRSIFFFLFLVFGVSFFFSSISLNFLNWQFIVLGCVSSQQSEDFGPNGS